MLRSVARLDEFRIEARERTPPAAAYSGWSTDSSLCSITCATSLTTSGEVWPIRAIRAATSACCSGANSSITLAASSVRRQVRDHERDRLRVLAAQERVDLVGRRAAQELERALLDHGRQPAQDLGRALPPDRPLEHLARIAKPPSAM